MSMYWLIIFLLLIKMISTNSDEFVTRNSSAEKRQRINKSMNNINFLNGGFHQSTKDTGIYLSKGIQKIPTNLNHQETINQQHNKSEGTSSKKNSFKILIANLSTLAKVRTAEKDFPVTGRVSKNTEGPTLFGKLSSRLHSNNKSLNTEIKQRNVRCYAIPKTVYVPEINEFIFAYACKLGNKIFILSSRRFFDERRTSLYVSIDNETLDKINSPAIDAESGQLRIIPTTIVLQQPGYNYYIHNEKDVILSEKHN